MKDLPVWLPPGYVVSIIFIVDLSRITHSIRGIVLRTMLVEHVLGIMLVEHLFSVARALCSTDQRAGAPGAGSSGRFSARRSGVVST
jgi:hypothetical protein